jgi:hypothetical protein
LKGGGAEKNGGRQTSGKITVAVSPSPAWLERDKPSLKHQPVLTMMRMFKFLSILVSILAYCIMVLEMGTAMGEGNLHSPRRGPPAIAGRWALDRGGRKL